MDAALPLGTPPMNPRRPRRAASAVAGVICCLLALWMSPAVLAAPNLTPTLLSHSASGRLWMARIEAAADTGKVTTTLMGRRIGADEAWRSYGQIQARSVALSNRGTDLIVLLENGDWTLLWPGEGGMQSASGLPIAKGKIIAMASDATTLWAIASVPGGLSGLRGHPTTAGSESSATRPATSLAPASGVLDGAQPRAGATTSPTTALSSAAASSQTPPNSLVLLSLNFDRWEWVPRAALPEGAQRSASPATSTAETTMPSLSAVSGGVSPMSMIVWKGKPIVAVHERGGIIELLSYTSAGWSAPERVKAGFTIKNFGLLFGAEQTPSPVLWVAAADSAGVIYTKAGGGWSDPVQLMRPADAPRVGPEKALASSAERLRLIYLSGHPSKSYEQQFDSQGHAIGSPDEIVLPGQTVRRVEWWMETAVMAALIFAMVAAMRRRRAVKGSVPAATDLALAPTRLRFAAGAVDAIPVLAGIVIFAVHYRGVLPTSASMTPDPFTEWVGLITFVVYIAHTTIFELLFARTIGKMIFGLKVVGYDGKRPGTMALLTRNLLRIIDLWLMGLPLLLIFYSPLRQRVGDAAAGTVVVTRTTAAGDAPESKNESDGEKSPVSSNDTTPPTSPPGPQEPA